MVGEGFLDTIKMQMARQQAATALASQNTAILNVEASKHEALNRLDQAHVMTNNGAGNVIMKQNVIGAPIPSISALRNLTPLTPNGQRPFLGGVADKIVNRRI